MTKSILELRTMPSFSERCLILDDSVIESDIRFTRIGRISTWWHAASEKPPKRRDMDPFSFGGALVEYLVLLDVIENGEDFQWRIFGGRHAQEFGADLTHMTISQLMQDHPAAVELREVMRTVADRRRPVPFEIRYMSDHHLLREAVGIFAPLADANGDITFIFGAADWIVAK